MRGGVLAGIINPMDLFHLIEKKELRTNDMNTMTEIQAALHVGHDKKWPDILSKNV